MHLQALFRTSCHVVWPGDCFCVRCLPPWLVSFRLLQQKIRDSNIFRNWSTTSSLRSRRFRGRWRFHCYRPSTKVVDSLLCRSYMFHRYRWHRRRLRRWSRSERLCLSPAKNTRVELSGGWLLRQSSRIWLPSPPGNKKEVVCMRMALQSSADGPQKAVVCGWPAAVVHGWPADAVVHGWPADAVVHGWPADAVVHGWPADAGVHGWPADAVVHGWPADAVVHGWPADVVVHGWPAEAVVCRWPAEAVVHGWPRFPKRVVYGWPRFPKRVVYGWPVVVCARMACGRLHVADSWSAASGWPQVRRPGWSSR